MSFFFENADELRAAGRRLGALLREGDAIALIGPLGAGKTTLAQSIVQSLGIEGEVSSPTFALMNVYDGPVPVYHLDMYRLEDPDRLALLGYDADLANSGITLVEWADKHWPFWIDDVLTIELQIMAGGRCIEVSTGGPRSAELAREWSTGSEVRRGEGEQ